MNQANEENSLDAPPGIPLKRKRGRPRKDKSINHGESAPVSPGFDGLNGNGPHEVDPIDDGDNGMVGQVVTGVVEAAFDAGYLLNVMIGNSNNCLRGVVFKPGHYVPVSAENDVAPHVRMIRRNDIHLSTENQTRIRGHNARFRERDEQHVNLDGNEATLLLNGSQLTSQVHRSAPRTEYLKTSKRKQVTTVAAPDVPLVGSRGTVVPVILQPVNLSNGLPLAKQNERVQASSHLSEAQIVNSKVTGKGSVKDASLTPEGHIYNMNEPVFVQPLQSIHSDGQSTPVSKLFDNSRIGRMTELLQENMTQKQASQAEQVAINSRLKSDD